MYNASQDFINAIKSNTRYIQWSGTINTTNEISFDDRNIISCEILREISGKKIEIGTVYSAQITVELYLPSISRYELYGKNISIFISQKDIADVIPMGIFTITEAIQTVDRIKIKGYDAMSKFEDVAFSPALNNEIQSPTQWIFTMCEECGVELGITDSQIKNLPNGDRKTGFADVVTDVKTWRDVLGYLGAYLGSYSYIGRDGKLYLNKYNSSYDDIINSSFRQTSNLSDFITTYDGLYATYKEEGLQEYVSNENENGLVLNLGINPFLQFTNSSNRKSALQEIIDSWNRVYYVPYSADMPLIPTYDVGDVLKFTDNQATQYDVGAITKITYNSNGKMKVVCSGDNPILADAQDRFTKTVAGLSSDYNNGQETGGKNFWLLHTENDASITVGNSKTLISQIDWKQTVDVQRMGFMFTCEADLSATATVDLLITVDDENDYEFDVIEEKSMKGNRIFSATCGFRVTDKGDHSAKVYMMVTDNPTLWSDIV